MANIFDKDTGNTDNHLLNEQFHAFSKSPSSPGSTLGGASNRSGHTVSASDVWAEKIPAFFYPKADSDYAVCKANAKLNDICRWGDEIQIWDGEKFVKFADNYAAIPDGHEFLNEDGQPVVRFHKSRVAYNLNDTNNAYDNSLDASGKGASAKILGWDKTANDGAGGVYTYDESAPQFITQFVAPTDNIVKGVPSKGYGPIVMVGGSPLTEDADSTAGYIANNFAGIIQFNERKTQGTVTVHAFEYCGKTLSTTASDIAELEDKLSKISVTAAGGVQAVSNAAKAAGFEIDSVVVEGVTTPTLDLTVAAWGSTEGIFSDATGNKAKLVTADALEKYVAKNAKVSVNGQDATTITVAGTAQGSSDLVKVVVTEDKTKANEIGLTLTATADVATVTSGVITSGHEGKLVKAGDAKAIAEKAITTSLTGTTAGTIGKAISDVKSTADSAIQGITLNGDTVNSKNWVNVGANNIIDITLPKLAFDTNVSGSSQHGITFNSHTDYDGAGISNHYVGIAAAAYTPLNGGNPGKWADGTLNYFTTASTVKTAIADAISSIDFPDIKVVGGDENYGISFSSEEKEGAGSSHYMHISTASYTASTDTWTNKGHLITGATVEAFVNDVVSEVSSDLATLESKVNAYHEAGVSYKVYDKQVSSEADLPDLSIEENVEKYKNVILLVPTSSRTDTDLDESEAISGGYIEYLCVKTGETTYAWEKIGTTEADLEGYARFISFANRVDVHTSPVYASISSDGYLNLGVDSATSSKLGVSKLFTGDITPGGHTNITDTAASLHSTAKMYGILAGSLEGKANASKVVSSINGIKGAINLCVHNHPASVTTENSEGTSQSNTTTDSNLWGMGVISGEFSHGTGKSINIIDTFVGLSASYLTTANLPSDAVIVENNFVSGEARYSGDRYVITTIRPERMVSGFNATPATRLTSFIADLSNLETSALPNQTVGTFYNMSALTTFIGDLSSLKNGQGMFYGCTSLTTFIGDLSSLEKGTMQLRTDATGMFNRTALTVESVENIADTLPEKPVVDITNVNDPKGCIAISWYQLTSDTAERQKLVDALNGVLDKGWVLVTNSELCAMFDKEKYQVVKQTVQAADLESEPQEIAYVIKK